MEYYRIKQKGYFRRYKYYKNINIQQLRIQKFIQILKINYTPDNIKKK